MNLLDDDVDGLLQAFRADEALLDDATRARMWLRICAEVADAPAALDGLVPDAGARRLRRRLGGATRVRALGVAAAVLVLLAVAGIVVGTASDDDSVTAGPATTTPLPRDLEQLADAVATRPVPVLGSSPDTRYAYQRYELSASGPGVDPVANISEQWVARDGSGQHGPDGAPLGPKGPGTYRLGLFTPEEALALPDDPDAVAATVDAMAGIAPFGPEVTPGLVMTLSSTGLPAAARAGLLRSLILADFVPVTAPDLAPNLMRVEGPGPEGSTMQADLDLVTGEVIRSARIHPDGPREVRTYIEVDLRADLRGS